MQILVKVGQSSMQFNTVISASHLMAVILRVCAKKVTACPDPNYPPPQLTLRTHKSGALKYFQDLIFCNSTTNIHSQPVVGFLYMYFLTAGSFVGSIFNGMSPLTFILRPILKSCLLFKTLPVIFYRRATCKCD